MTDDAANSATAPAEEADASAVAPESVALEGRDADPATAMTVEQRRSLAATTLRHARRVVILVSGLAVVAAGIAMLVLPGPGLVAIIAGLAILATEFAWAQNYLEKAKEKAAQGVDVGKKAVGRLRKKP